MSEQILPPAIINAQKALAPEIFATVLNGDRLCPKAYKALPQDHRLHVRDVRAYAAEQKSVDWLPQIAKDLGGELRKFETRTLKNGTKRTQLIVDVVPPKQVRNVTPRVPLRDQLAAEKARNERILALAAKAGVTIDI